MSVRYRVILSKEESTTLLFLVGPLSVISELQFAKKCTHNLFGDMYGKLRSHVNIILLKCETNWEHD
jgi:hypothetical protein